MAMKPDVALLPNRFSRRPLLRLRETLDGLFKVRDG